MADTLNPIGYAGVQGHPLRIGIAGPIATSDIADLLTENAAAHPSGYVGAPLLSTLIRELLRRGHHVSAFTTSSDLAPLAAPHVASGPNFTIYFCPYRKRAFRRKDKVWGRALDFFRIERRALRTAMVAAKVDLIHAHWTYEFAMAAIESGLPTIVTCHDAPQVVLEYSRDLYRLIRYLLARRVLARASSVSAVSPYLKERVASYVKGPVEVIPNPVVMPRSVGADKQGRLTNCDAPRLIMVLNGWTALKNARSAFLAFSAFRACVPGAELLLVGRDFDPGGPAEEWALEHGVHGGMTFLGQLPHRQVLELLDNVDLLVHPALEETFGMAIAESMARGVPVVGGAESGAVPWMIGSGGVVCDVTSPDAIADAISQILRDVATHQRFSDAARREIGTRFAVNFVANEYERLYRRCLHTWSTARRGADVQG